VSEGGGQRQKRERPEGCAPYLGDVCSSLRSSRCLCEEEPPPTRSPSPWKLRRSRPPPPPQRRRARARERLTYCLKLLIGLRTDAAFPRCAPPPPLLARTLLLLRLQSAFPRPAAPLALPRRRQAPRCRPIVGNAGDSPPRRRGCTGWCAMEFHSAVLGTSRSDRNWDELSSSWLQIESEA